MTTHADEAPVKRTKSTEPKKYKMPRDERQFLEEMASLSQLELSKTLARAFGLDVAFYIGYLKKTLTWEQFQKHAIKEGRKIDHHDRMYREPPDPVKDARMSKETIRRCQKVLEKIGYLKIVRLNNPPREYYELDEDALWDEIERIEKEEGREW